MLLRYSHKGTSLTEGKKDTPTMFFQECLFVYSWFSIAGQMNLIGNLSVTAAAGDDDFPYHTWMYRTMIFKGPGDVEHLGEGLSGIEKSACECGADDGVSDRILIRPSDRFPLLDGYLRR